MLILRHRFHLLLSLASPACGGSDLALPTDPPAAQLEMVQGDEQVGLPGAPLRDPLIVRVTDSTGSPLPGQAVTWSVNGGGGAVDPVTDSSNSEGLAFAEWILGPSPGLNVVEAQVAASDVVTFTARAEVGGGGDDDGPDTGPARLSLVEGTGQSAEAGSPVAVRPAVLVTDSAGEPVAGVAVTFVVTAGGGSVKGAAQTTGSNGVARVDRWTLGAEPGTNTLEARSGSLAGSPVVFMAEGTEPEPEPEPEVDRLVFLTPPPAQVGVNETFRFSVALVDADGDVVPLPGIFIYVGLFAEGRDSPTNDLITGERFENTDQGIAEFDLSVDRRGRYRIRALTDDLPELGPHGPEPWLYSSVFEVK